MLGRAKYSGGVGNVVVNACLDFEGGMVADERWGFFAGTVGLTDGGGGYGSAGVYSGRGGDLGGREGEGVRVEVMEVVREEYELELLMEVLREAARGRTMASWVWVALPGDLMATRVTVGPWERWREELRRFLSESGLGEGFWTSCIWERVRRW